MENSYSKKNNELVENFLLALRSEFSCYKQASNLFIQYWKCIIKLPYNDANVNLTLVSSCNLILSQMLHDYLQLDCAKVLDVCYKALNKTVWWGPSHCHNQLVENISDLTQEITKLLDTFMKNEELFLKAGEAMVYLCTLTYLFSMDSALLNIIKEAIMKRGVLKKDCYSKCNNKLLLLTPSCHTYVELDQEETRKSIFEFARTITEMDSSETEHLAKTGILPSYIQACLTLSKQFSKTHPSVLQEFLRSSHHSPMFSCLSSSIVATHLLSSIKPALVIKLLSLSLRETENSFPASVQASSAGNLVHQLQTHSTQNIALDLAERDLLKYALTDMSQQPHKDADMFLVSIFRLLCLPSPSWVQLKLARMLLSRKQYEAAVTKYYDLVNSPLCSKAAGERHGRLLAMPSPDFKVLAHELALSLLLSNKVDELKSFLANSDAPDFVMLIIQTKLFLKLQMFEDGVKALNRALIHLEHSEIHPSVKDWIFEVCHLKLEQLVSLRSSMFGNSQVSTFPTSNMDKPLPTCPSCNGTNISSYRNCYQFAKDLAICHLFHEV